tara:strand:+ start:36506 stop:38272 length:1767 start_codon:yes stop_codon:yes gene_type:complete
MAQIAIPILLLGTAYLISNEQTDDDDKEKQDDTCYTKYNKEPFTNLKDIDNRGSLLSKEYDNYYPNISKTKNNVNDGQTVSQYQDKYFLENNYGDSTSENNKFKKLDGEIVNYKDINHNNMNYYYGSKTGEINTKVNTASILDNYTGQGSYDIKKEEISSMFKPEDNLQNVYGNQNQNDFFQSRANVTNRQANTKPWKEIKVSPGIGKSYNDVTNNGFNNYNENRDMWLPKTVDELRASNNPKNTYCLDNHMGPAIDPIKTRGNIGKIVKQGPDTYFVNNSTGIATGNKKHTSGSEQMLTKENRDDTSIEYYGARGNNESVSYSNGEYMDPHKQQLGATPIINLNNNNVNPTSSQNYSKGSYNIDQNNRTTVNSYSIGNIQSTISNITQPIMNGLRHSKKTNIINNLQSSGNVKMPTNKHMNQSKILQMPTNREMYETNLQMNHLNIEKQSGNAYSVTNPILNNTQRNSMNQSQTGPASSYLSGNTSYESNYNQNNINKVHACNSTPNGNMGLFNNKIVSRETNNECHNNRSTPFYDPMPSNYTHPTETLGAVTSMPQNYENKMNNIDNNMLNAFKNNPYTQPLNSVA